MPKLCFFHPAHLLLLRHSSGLCPTRLTCIGVDNSKDGAHAHAPSPSLASRMERQIIYIPLQNKGTDDGRRVAAAATTASPSLPLCVTFAFLQAFPGRSRRRGGQAGRNRRRIGRRGDGVWARWSELALLSLKLPKESLRRRRAEIRRDNVTEWRGRTRTHTQLQLPVPALPPIPLCHF